MPDVEIAKPDDEGDLLANRRGGAFWLPPGGPTRESFESTSSEE